MGLSDRSYSYGQSGGFSGGMRFGGAGSGSRITTWVLRLLVANTAIFLFMAVDLLDPGWMVGAFGFTPDMSHLLTHPWTPITYMFLHGGFWHLFVNMLVLFFFGPPLERAWGSRSFLRFYVVAGLGGALFSFLFLPLPDVGQATVVIGASGAIYGVMLAFALMWPESPIYIWGLLPVKAKWFVGVLAAITFYASFTGGGDNVAHWAHLGGLVTGFVYLKVGDRLGGLMEGARSRMRSMRSSLPDAGSSARERLRGSKGGSGKDDEDEFSRKDRTSGDVLDEVDRILDKIREEGLESLTEKEREFLDEMSRRYRG